MKKPACAVVLIVLVSVGLMRASSGSEPAPAASIADVLKAHNVPPNYGALAVFKIEAVKLTSYLGGGASDLPNFFERKVTVSIDGGSFRRHKQDPLGIREEIDVFDGRVGYHAELENGNRVGEIVQMQEPQSDGLWFSIRTFGLLPILNELSDLNSGVVYLGRTPRNEEKFELKALGRSWIIFVDHRRLITRIKTGDKTIEYAAYRAVDGLQLPFVERFYVKDQLSSELIFTEIDVNPSFPDGHFGRDALSKEATR